MSRPTPAVAVRPATAADLSTVVAHRLRFLCDVRATDLNELEPAFIEATTDFVTRTHMTTFLSWLAEVDDECVGIVSMIISDAPPRPEEHRCLDGYIVNMHVDESRRSTGVGRRLITTCLADARAMGVRKFLLHATDDGRPLYESLGFADQPGWMHSYR